MQRLACALAVLSLPWLASQAFAADCNRPEYGPLAPLVAPCDALGIHTHESASCTDDTLATAKAEVDWVLSGNAAALEAYRASVREQIACGYPSIPITFQRALLVAARGHDPLAQCVITACNTQIDHYMQDLEDQGKLPKY